MKQVTKFKCETCGFEYDDQYQPEECVHCGNEACKYCLYEFESPNHGHIFFLTLHTDCLEKMAEDKIKKHNYSIRIFKK